MKLSRNAIEHAALAVMCIDAEEFGCPPPETVYALGEEAARYYMSRAEAGLLAAMPKLPSGQPQCIGMDSGSDCRAYGLVEMEG